MTERNRSLEIRNILPQESLQLNENDNFVGETYIVTSYGSVHREEICIPKDKTIKLKDFYYKKPIVEPGKDAFDQENISIEEEKTPRQGYLLLKIIRGVGRYPNHLHNRQDDGFLCAVQKDSEWEFRFFPKESLDKKFWDSSEKEYLELNNINNSNSVTN